MPYISGNYETPEQLGFFPGAGALVSVGSSIFGRKRRPQMAVGTYMSQYPDFDWERFYQNEVPQGQKNNYMKFVRKGKQDWGSPGDFAAWWIHEHTKQHPQARKEWFAKLEKYRWPEQQAAAPPQPATPPKPVRQAPPPPPAEPQKKDDGGAWDAIGKIFEALGPAQPAPQQTPQIVTQAAPQQAPTVITVPGASSSPAPAASAPAQTGLPPWALPVGAGALALFFLMRRN